MPESPAAVSHTVAVTLPRSASILVLGVLVVGLGACSSSSKQSATTTLPATGTTVTAPPVTGELGPCPAIFPRAQLSTLNAGVAGVDAKLVPFDATSVRVCTYSLKSLTGSGTLTGSAATTFETDTNALTKAAGPITCAKQNITRLFYLSFQGATQRVHLGESDACGGGVSNGTFVAKEAAPWTTEVLHAAAKKPSTVVTAPQ